MHDDYMVNDGFRIKAIMIRPNQFLDFQSVRSIGTYIYILCDFEQTYYTIIDANCVVWTEFIQILIVRLA